MSIKSMLSNRYKDFKLNKNKIYSNKIVEL